MKKGIFSFFLVFFGGVIFGHAADLRAGKKTALKCNVCHGKNGLAVNPEAPNLAGESDFYIEKQLIAFRSGARKHHQMSIIAKGLKDEDIENLAAWYGAMKVSVELPDIK
ncbi:MAG: cytochrome c [Hyphomicrobiales bacterium]